MNKPKNHVESKKLLYGKIFDSKHRLSLSLPPDVGMEIGLPNDVSMEKLKVIFDLNKLENLHIACFLV
jgi:hypothetical protein